MHRGESRHTCELSCILSTARTERLDYKAMLSAEKPSSSLGRWVLAAYWVSIYFLTHWPDVDRFTQGVDWPSDKVVHAGMYAGWAFLWWRVLGAALKPVPRAAVIWLLVGAAGYGVFDELTQAIVGRQPDVWDFACDMLGAGGVLLTLYLLQKREWAARGGAVRSRA